MRLDGGWDVEILVSSLCTTHRMWCYVSVQRARWWVDTVALSMRTEYHSTAWLAGVNR